MSMLGVKTLQPLGQRAKDRVDAENAQHAEVKHATRRPVGLAMRPSNQVTKVTTKNNDKQPSKKVNGAIENCDKVSINKFNAEQPKVTKQSTRQALKTLPTNGSRIPKAVKETAKPLQKQKEASMITEPPLSFSSLLVPEDVENIDHEDIGNVLLEPNLVNDIYMYIRYLEAKLELPGNFLQNQKELTGRIRSRVVDWLIEVHRQFRLLPETLYLTVALMDRYLASKQVPKNRIQLVAVTAIFIASKYEEIYPPELSDFLSISDASKTDLFKLEIDMLRQLKFDLSSPLPLHFLRRFSKAAHADSLIHSMAKYLMELCLVDYECASWRPSKLAAASLYLTLQLNRENAWNQTMVFYTGYTEKELQPAVSIICKLVLQAENSKYQSCYKKYSQAKLMSVSTLSDFQSNYVKAMAAAKY